MDWDWRNFSGESIFRENPRVSCLSDSVESSGSEGLRKNGEGAFKGTSQESSRLSPSSQGSSKRTRLLSGTQTQTCLVDGCESDLSNCKEYHRRHRVCDLHSKTPVVLVRSEEKRFCQQCSRFHSLSEFDEVKRSCRKRLDGHNRRRRKTQPESLFMTSGEFLTNCRGPILLQFSNPQIHVTDFGKSLWPAAAESEEKGMIPLNSSACFNYGGEKQLSVQKNGRKNGRPESSLCQPLSETILTGSQLGSRKMLPTDILPPVDSGCALYLLSSHTAQAVPDAGLSSLAQSHQILPVQTQQQTELHFNESSGSFGLKEKPGSKTSFYGNSLLEIEEPEGLFEREVPHKFPIFWE